MGFQVWGLGYEVRSLGFGIRGFNFQVAGLGFRVQGMGFGMRVGANRKQRQDGVERVRAAGNLDSRFLL